MGLGEVEETASDAQGESDPGLGELLPMRSKNGFGRNELSQSRKRGPGRAALGSEAAALRLPKS